MLGFLRFRGHGHHMVTWCVLRSSIQASLPPLQHTHLTQTAHLCLRAAPPSGLSCLRPPAGQRNPTVLRDHLTVQRRSQHAPYSQGPTQQGPKPGTATAKFRLQTRLAVTVLFGAGILGTWWYVRKEKQDKLQRQRIEQLRKVAIGQGDFSLLDHTGQRRTKRRPHREDLEGESARR